MQNIDQVLIGTDVPYDSFYKESRKGEKIPPPPKKKKKKMKWSELLVPNHDYYRDCNHHQHIICNICFCSGSTFLNAQRKARLLFLKIQHWAHVALAAALWCCEMLSLAWMLWDWKGSVTCSPDTHALCSILIKPRQEREREKKKKNQSTSCLTVCGTASEERTYF